MSDVPPVKRRSTEAVLGGEQPGARSSGRGVATGTVLLSSLVPLAKSPALSIAGPLVALGLPRTLPVAAEDRRFRRFAWACGLAALGFTVSSLAAGEATVRIIGAALLPVGLLSMVATFLYLGRLTGNVRGIAIGVLLAHAAYFIIHPTTEFNIDPWKFGLGVPATLLSGIALGKWWAQGRRWTTVAGALALAALNIALGFRSLAGIALTAGILLVMQRKGMGLTGGRLVGALTLAIALGFLLGGLYSSLASSGQLGAEQKAKFTYESGTQAGVLFASRPEFFVSITAIERHPLIGLGSSAQLDYATASEALQRAADLGLDVSLGQQQRLVGSGVNSHSLALGSWVQGGLLTMGMWVAVLALAFRVATKTNIQGDADYPLLLMWAGLTLWDMIFSPWSPHYAVVLAAFVAWSLDKMRGATTA